MMSNNFNLYSKYYNLLNAEKNYSAEGNYIADCIKHYFPEAKTILEFGSGTGGHGLVLQNKGFQVYGLERSQQMVNEAKKLGFPCQEADITCFKLNKKFDAVISLFHVISYITDNESLINVFKNAEMHLKYGGLFIFDVWYSPAVYHQKPEVRVKKVENSEFCITRKAEPEIYSNKNVVEVNYCITVLEKNINKTIEFHEKHPMRHFSIPEIELLALLTGFELIKTEEFLTRNKPSENTWGVNFILKKTENNYTK